MDVTFDCFGSDRLMFGSDWPVCTLAASYSRTFDVVNQYLGRYTVQVRDAVLGGNAQQLWNLNMQGL
jgi:L-fuconolactonase